MPKQKNKTCKECKLSVTFRIPFKMSVSEVFGGKAVLRVIYLRCPQSWTKSWEDLTKRCAEPESQKMVAIPNPPLPFTQSLYFCAVTCIHCSSKHLYFNTDSKFPLNYWFWTVFASMKKFHFWRCYDTPLFFSFFFPKHFVFVFPKGMSSSRCKKRTPTSSAPLFDSLHSRFPSSQLLSCTVLDCDLCRDGLLRNRASYPTIQNPGGF